MQKENTFLPAFKRPSDKANSNYPGN